MKSTDLVVGNCRQLLTCRGPIPKRGKELQDVGLIEGGWVASFKGEIVFVGGEEEFKSQFRPAEDCLYLDGSRFVGLPGFVDSHTHLPFAGTREEEFALRLQGFTYQQLAAKGLGIQTTVQATRLATEDELISLCLPRLDQMLLHGTTTAEAKSGYGLNFEDELKQLRALRRLDETHPVSVVPTFMGAHEVPKEFRERRQDYIDFLVKDLMPEVRTNGLAEFFDIFCEEGVFSLEETRKLVRAAKAAGFKIKVHADEFASLGGAALAAEEGAVSAEHLINIDEAGIRRLARSETAAILLPAVPFFLMLDKKAPARKLVEAGAVVALASDFNPGSSMTESMLFVLQLGVFMLRMGIEEAVNACTANAAYALGLEEKVGSLEVGKKMDMVLCDIPKFAFLVYHLGINPIRHVVKAGRIVVKDGLRV